MKQSTYTLLLLIFLQPTLLFAQNEGHSIAFYNVENLFDTLDTPGKDDAEFLPNGKNEWNSTRYFEKIAHINQVINSMEAPMIMGLCEIENKAVVKDIVRMGKLNGTHAIVHHESLDARGIDNAIIYDSTKLVLVEDGFIRFEMPEGDSPSRDIVWAKFQYQEETFVVMVNHWPSRRGGELVSEPKRLIAANAAADFIDSLQTEDKNAQIIFMGDLNDYPTDRAPQMISERLRPMITPASGEFGGSNNYRGEWNILDHIMVSKSMTKKNGLSVAKKSGAIHSFDYLITTYKDNLVPFRTYGGGKYLAGYSDHLPVSVQLNFPK